MPGQISDLRGRSFGRLTISLRAVPEIRNGRAWWPCTCECGEQPTVRASRLVQGRQISCGCYRADPVVRQVARLQVPARERKEISRLGAAASVAAGKSGRPRKAN